MASERQAKSHSDPRPVFVVDTREQLPYAFDPECVTVLRCALPAADYSLEGHEDRVGIERKSLNDFVNTVIRERERFKRELEKLREYDLACVVVEADLRDVIRGRYRSQVHPNAILGGAMAIFVDYGIPVLFCSDREIAARFVMGLLLRYRKRIDATTGEGQVDG